MKNPHNRQTLSQSGLDCIDDAAQSWFLLLAGGAATAADRVRFAAWRDADLRHRVAYDEVCAVWESAAELREAFAASPVQAVADPAPNVSKASAHTGWYQALRGAAAAVIVAVVVVMAAEVSVRIQADHITAVGEQARVLLPDGSIAWLNTNTAIAVNYDTKHRTVSLLRGEAQFEVNDNPARPFQVMARAGRSTALGTVFTVRDRGPGVTVSVSDGIVEVVSPADAAAGIEADHGARALLPAGRQLSYREGEAPGPIRLGDGTAAAWRDGSIAINNLSLESAFAELDRYHPGWILVQADTRDLEAVTANLSVEAIDEGIEALAMVHGLKVTRIADYLVIVH